MSKTIINPPQLAPPRGFNHAFLCEGGRVLFLAGQIASDASGRIITDDLVGQYEQVLRNLQAVVETAGGRMQDIVKLNIFVKNRNDYVSQLRPLGQVHKQYFGDHYPAMALFEVNAFFEEGTLIEMEGFAYLD